MQFEGIKQDQPKVNLFFNWYESKDRQHEIDQCLEINKQNFDRVILLEGRPTFSEMFERSKEFPNDINVYCNSDIYFTKEAVNLLHNIKENECYALTRYDEVNGQLVFFNRNDSQDTWVFRGVVRPIKAYFNTGAWGCLSGDTMIYYSRLRCGNRKITLKRLFENFASKWNDGTEIRTYSLYENGKMFYNKIINVVESGIKPTIKIIFHDESFLILTSDHRVCIGINKFIEAENLNPGDYVLAKGSMKHIIKPKKKRIQSKYIYLKNHPYAEVKFVRGHRYLRVKKYRLIVEADMNGMSLESYVSALNENVSALKFLDPKLEVHHKDHDHSNDELSNLQVMTKADHARHHYVNGSVPERESYVYKQIAKIEPHEEIMTYDIQMQSPANNFVANDIIVHNCDNHLAWLIKNIGYDIKNPSLSIKTVHVHKIDRRCHARTESNTVKPPYLQISPTNL